MSRDDRDGPGGFEQRARRALTEGGFVPPRASEICVLLCDSAGWTDQAASAELLLDVGEQARAARFRFADDRATYVLAHGLWRLALANTLGIDATSVPLKTTSRGKPELPGMGFATSLSHSGRWIAIAIGQAATLGIDIELSPPRMRMTELMSTICSPAELIELKNRPAAVLESGLLSLWTRKEALLKAFGVGLAEAPASFSARTMDLVVPPASAPTQVSCRVHELAFPAGVIGALATPISVSVSAIRVIRII